MIIFSSYFFLLNFAQNIDFGYTLEPPQLHGHVFVMQRRRVALVGDKAQIIGFSGSGTFHVTFFRDVFTSEEHRNITYGQ